MIKFSLEIYIKTILNDKDLKNRERGNKLQEKTKIKLEKLKEMTNKFFNSIFFAIFICILIVLSMPTCFILLIESMRYFPLLHSLVPFVLIHGTIWIVLTITGTLVNKNQPQCCQLSLDLYSFSDKIWFTITFFATLFIFHFL